MSEKSHQPDPLRIEAETRLARASASASSNSLHTADELLHELRLHQIELEIQNESLRQTQLILEESRDRYVDLYDFAPIGYLTLTRDALIAEVNLSCADLLGVERNKLSHRRFAYFVMPEDQPRWHQYFLSVVQHAERQVCELSLKRGDGSIFQAQLDAQQTPPRSLSSEAADDGFSVRIALTDITERKQMEVKLRNAQQDLLENIEDVRNKIEAAHQEWMTALDVVNDPIFLHDKELRILRCNRAYQQCAGIPFKQIIGQPYYAVFPKTGAPPACCLQVMGKAEAAASEDEILFGDVTYRLRTFSVYDEQQDYHHSVHILEDITEHKRMTAAIIESEEHFRVLYESSRDAIMLMSPEWIFLSGNPAAVALFGCRGEAEFTALSSASVSPEFQPDGRRSDVKAQEMMRLTQENGANFFEWTYRRMDGKFFPADVQLTFMIVGGKSVIHANVRDITERKQAEAAIYHANRALATLSAVNRNLVNATEENALLQAICQAIVQQRGYLSAWVGYVQHDEVKSIKMMASAGHDEGYLDVAQLTWAEGKFGMRASGAAIRSGVTQISQDIANDPRYLPWRAIMLQSGFASNIALPLLKGNNTVFGILNVYADEVNAFSSAEVALLEEMAGDLAFGVQTLHTRHERDIALEKIDQQFAQLQDSLEDTIRAIATIVEMRDPYTAGHQVRVADLAAAIGREMGLPDEQVHAIHLAGMVHDLGKIQVPAEILSKPGKIIDIEYNLIKIHPQAGYDILKGINFPWPIAQMVLQHHERLDGSGYPQGLKGDAILLGARILTVADVVEAMSSHRPYRPGLGDDAALEEITHARGIHYDAQVVDACVTLFKEHGYVLPK